MFPALLKKNLSPNACAMSMVAGTARSMGITVDGKAPWEN